MFDIQTKYCLKTLKYALRSCRGVKLLIDINNLSLPNEYDDQLSLLVRMENKTPVNFKHLYLLKVSSKSFFFYRCIISQLSHNCFYFLLDQTAAKCLAVAVSTKLILIIILHDIFQIFKPLFFNFKNPLLASACCCPS